MQKEYDIIIVGAGAAGLTAAIYASRRALKTLVLSKDIGGQAALATEIENYPGRELVNGAQLMSDFKKQAEKFGAEFVLSEVEKIEKQADKFLIKTPHEQYLGHAVILAFGLTPKDLGIPGEEEFKGRGVSYCATCDGPFFKNKVVVVVGGGNSALDAADLLSKIATKVYMIQYLEKFTGEHVLEKRVREKENVEIFLNSQVLEIKGETTVKAVRLKNNQTNEEKEIPCDGVFIEVGYVAKTDVIKDLVKLDERRQIIIDRDCETSQAGVFAAGDVSDITYKQVVISAGEGAKAALQAYKYLQKKGTIRAAGVDWGKRK